MFEKNLNVGYLLDFYGDLLPERKRSVLEMYYDEDYSLAEIADEIGISRQGVRDCIKKGEEELLFFEEKLGLARRFRGFEEPFVRFIKALLETEAVIVIKPNLEHRAVISGFCGFEVPFVRLRVISS